MNITLDFSSIVYGRGVSSYTSNLVLALSLQSDVSLRLFGFSLRQTEVLKEFAQQVNLPAKILPVPPKLMSTLWYQLNHPSIDTLVGKSEVFHAWEEFVPPSRDVPVVATIHDLAILKYPETAHPSTRYKHRQAWKRLKNTDAQIIAVSQSTKQDLIDILDFVPENITVVYESQPEESKRPVSEQEVAQLQQKYHLHKPFLLFVGTREPRKNIARLIEAWGPLKKEVDLVLVGEFRWGPDETQIKQDQHLKIIGRVNDQELAVFYKAAETLVFPSLYEGFGLPILEAFYHDTPVVTSRTSSLPEVGGKAAFYVDPLEVHSIRDGISQALQQTKVEKKQRSQLMRKQLSTFDWQKTAQQTYEVYKKAREKNS